MSQPNHEQKAFEDYLQGGTPLSATYQQSPAGGPSELTEARILAAAKAAITNKSSGSPFGGYQRMLPTSIAAVFILAITAMFIADQYQTPPQPAPVISRREPAKSLDTDATRLTEEVKQKSLSAPKEMPAARPVELARNDAALPPTAPAAAPVASGSSAPTRQAYPSTSMDSLAKQDKPAPTAAVSTETRAKLELAQQRSVADSERKKEILAMQSPDAVIRPADVWLVDITRLLKEQKQQQARNELLAFRKHYPSYIIEAKRYPEVARLLTEIKPNEP